MGAVLGAKAAAQLLAAPWAARAVCRWGGARALAAGAALLAGAAALLARCGGAACAGGARALHGAGSALAGVAGLALCAGAPRRVPALLGAVALGARPARVRCGTRRPSARLTRPPRRRAGGLPGGRAAAGRRELPAAGRGAAGRPRWVAPLSRPSPSPLLPRRVLCAARPAPFPLRRADSHPVTGFLGDPVAPPTIGSAEPIYMDGTYL